LVTFRSCINKNIYNFDIFSCTSSSPSTATYLCYWFHIWCWFQLFWHPAQLPLITVVKQNHISQLLDSQIISVPSTPHPLTQKIWLFCQRFFKFRIQFRSYTTLLLCYSEHFDSSSPAHRFFTSGQIFFWNIKIQEKWKNNTVEVVSDRSYLNVFQLFPIFESWLRSASNWSFSTSATTSSRKLIIDYKFILTSLITSY